MRLRSNPATLLAAMLVFLPMAANAQFDNRYYGSLSYGITTGDDRVRLSDDGFGPSFAVGRHVSSRWDTELGIWFADFDAQTAGGAEWRESGLRLDGLRYFSRNPGFAPFALIGGGLVVSERSTGGLDARNAMANIGLGFTRRLHKSGMSLRSEARYRLLVIDDPQSPRALRAEEVQLFAGIQLPLGRVAKTRATRLAVKTPVAVAPPLDSDGDGVIDELDRCPRSPAGTRVDPRGCPTVVPDVLEDVTFAVNSAVINRKSAAELDRVAPEIIKLMNENPTVTVEVAGHTDSADDAAANRRMSDKRAEAVRAYLVGKGIPTARLVSRGYGEAWPIHDNATALGRRLNRRVELKILK